MCFNGQKQGENLMHIIMEGKRKKLKGSTPTSEVGETFRGNVVFVVCAAQKHWSQCGRQVTPLLPRADGWAGVGVITTAFRSVYLLKATENCSLKRCGKKR